MKGLLTERIAVLGTIDPDAYGTGTQGSDWMDLSKFGQVAFVVQVGEFQSGAKVDFKVQQATAAAGTGAKDISGKAITQLTEAGTDGDKQVIVVVRHDELDTANRYRYVRGYMTISVDSVDSAVLVLGGDPVYAPAKDFDLASVAEIVF